MRRLFAAIIVLLQFFVQFLPLVQAEDIQVIFENSPFVEPVATDIDPANASGATVPSGQDAGTGVTFPLDPLSTTATGSVSFSGTVTPPASSMPASSGAVVAVPAAVPVRVVVTEVMWMGSDVSTADEWVEIAAFGSGASSIPRSLSGWTLVTVRAGTETTVVRLRAEHVIASGGVMVIANYRASSSRLAAEPSLVTTGMGLPNTQLLLRLKNASGSIVDEIDDGVGVPMAGANPSTSSGQVPGGGKASMERIDPWRSGNDASNWKTATSAIGFDDGPPIFGTPGSYARSPGFPASSSSPSSSSSSSISIAVSPPPMLRLTEIMANPPSIDTDEWVEVGSFDATPVDLAEVALRIGTVRFGLFGTLAPGEHRRFGKILTGLPLPNPGGTVEVLWRDRVIDSWTYVETAEGVSLGRAGDGGTVPQCVPSPDAPNTNAPLDPSIGVQSSTAGTATLSLNLEVTVATGSLTGAACSWAYPDGYVSVSCNPPSHSLPGPLVGDVVLVLRDYCGNTMTRTLHVDVPGKFGEKTEENDVPMCIPTAFSGVLLSEVFPNPPGDEAESEWIELLNPSSVERSLCGWSVDDGKRGSAPYRLDRWRLPAGERLALPRKLTGIALSNDGDAVRLFAPLRQGGSGAYEIIRYQSSPEGKTYARRDDGAWVWTQPTPGEQNVFAEVRVPVVIEARIAAALPNPAGSDADGDEWVEIENATAFPLPLTGWKLETASASRAIENVVLGPSGRVTVPFPSLANGDGFVRLLDRDGTVQSVLTWKNAKDDQRVSQPAVVADVSGLSLLSSDDCLEWIARDAEGLRRTVVLDGIFTDEKIQCIDYVSALTENKKVDQKMYSINAVHAASFVDGVDIASLLLRHGLAAVDEASSSPLLPAYRLDEEEARTERRGMWASDERVALIDASRKEASWRAMLAVEGLRIMPSIRSGVIDGAENLAIETNVPASVTVAVGSGGFRPYAGPIVIDRDTDVSIEAESLVQNASGYSVFVKSFQSYRMLKSRYPTLRVSEVYPSPAKGEYEWVELYNPTDETVSLVGWSIDDMEDAGSKADPFGAGDILRPMEHRIFSGSSVAWNNDGDDVRLIDPRGRVSHAFSYGSVKTGRAFAVSIASDGDPMGGCVTMQPTPGGPNRCAAEPQKAAKKKKPSKTAFRFFPRSVRYRNMLESGVAATFLRDRFSSLLTHSAYRVHSTVSMAAFGVLSVVAALFSLWLVRIARMTIEKKP